MYSSRTVPRGRNREEVITQQRATLSNYEKEGPQPKRLRASLSHRFPLGMDFCRPDIELNSGLCLHAVQHEYQ
jgi:hypothetical protein